MVSVLSNSRSIPSASGAAEPGPNRRRTGHQLPPPPPRAKQCGVSPGINRRWSASLSRGASPGPPPPGRLSPRSAPQRPGGSPGERCTGFPPAPGRGPGIPRTPLALPSSWPCASPGHPSGLDGPCCIRFRHLRSKVLGWTVLETSKISVKSSLVAPSRADLFHNLSTFHLPSL